MFVPTLLAASGATHAARPNIILVLVDDLGWKDFGVTGSTVYRTPNIDQFAREGVRFRRAYSAGSVCSPTRTAIMTGQNPARVGITDWLPGAGYSNQKLLPAPMPEHLPPAITTLPEALRHAGYATWLVGKWHLGADPFGPTANGFDVNIAGNESGHPVSYFYPYGNEGNDYNRVRPLSGGKSGEYLTDRLTDEAIGLMRRRDDRPFFLMLSHYTVHMPLMAKAEDFQRYESLVGKDFSKRRATYAAMIDNLDQNIGRLMQSLKAEKLDQNTLVLITSDNGGLHDLTDNQPLRQGKGLLYEGGVRVPLLARWPGNTPSATCEAPVISTDFYSTFVEVAGAHAPTSQSKDGQSFAQLLTNPNARKKPRTLYWHYPHYHTDTRPPCSAIQDGNWKLIHWYEDGREELYDLAVDPGESENQADAQPKKRAELSGRLMRWLKSVNAKFATENPAYKPKNLG